MLLRLLARRAGFHRASLVDSDAAAAELRVVKHGDGFVRRLVIGHLDEGETARTLRFTIHRDENRQDFTSLGEVRADLLFRRAERDTTHKQLGGHGVDVN